MLVVKLNYRIELHKLKTGNDVKLELSYYIYTFLSLRHFPFWNLKTGNDVKLELSYYIYIFLSLRHFPFWNLKTGNEET